MIVVIYKNVNKNGVIQIPFKNIKEAKMAADSLFSKGYLGVKISELNERILYIPQK